MTAMHYFFGINKTVCKKNPYNIWQRQEELPSTRHFLDISYKGTHYHGWQRQKELSTTVQGTIEAALAKIRIPLLISGSSRTDKGVHAEQQIAHIDLPNNIIETAQLRHKLNSLLPNDIYLRDIQPVPADAHARFDALARTYTYRVITRPNPFLTEASHYCPYPLDLNAMNKAAKLLLGEHNCKSFCKGHADVPNHICHIKLAHWHEQDENLTFMIQANRFVHGMVRAIVGTLLEVGRKRLTPDDFQAIIDKRDRNAAKSAAPPQGLFLTKVAYPPHIYPA